jgi:hypothetical protein
MTKITGVYRNGVIELLGPAPPDWNEGRQVDIPCGETDLTGDSPQAIAAWAEEMRQIHAQLSNDGFYEEVQQALNRSKAEELAMWDQSNARLEQLEP